MRNLTLRLLSGIAALSLAAGCSDTPTEPGDETAELALAFDGLAADANRGGDAEGAASLSAGSLALRMGVRPSVIDVVIEGESVRHFALVAAVSRVVDGQPRLLQTLFAWTGLRRPNTILEVGILGEQGTFSHEASAEPAGRARGVYLDLVRRMRWIATSGGAAIDVASTGAACGRALSENPNIECVKARFNVRMDGLFQRREMGADGPVTGAGISISTDAEGVHGVVVGPAGN